MHIQIHMQLHLMKSSTRRSKSDLTRMLLTLESESLARASLGNEILQTIVPLSRTFLCKYNSI